MNIEVGSEWQVKDEPSETLKVLVSGQAVTYEFEDYSGEVIAETLVKEDFLKRFEPVKQDMVNHPSHYTSDPSGIECIEITEEMGFVDGNCFKYLYRAEHKGNELQDLEKAHWYANRARELGIKVPQAVIRPIESVSKHRNINIMRAMLFMTLSDWERVMIWIFHEIDTLKNLGIERD